MKVLLVSLNAKFVHTSLAIRYLQAYCRQEFPEIRIREFTINEDPGEVMAEIYREEPDILGFSCYIWNIEATLRLARNLKKVRPNLIIVLGGPEVTFDSRALLSQNPYIDVVVRGEGEVTFLELLRGLASGGGQTVRGTTWRCGERVIHNEDRELIADLGQVPFPYATGVDELAGRIIYYESSRGCPFNCSYCISSTVRGVRWFPLERVKKELRFFVEQGVREVKFVDRTFNADPRRSREILKTLVENRGNTTFHLEIVADRLDDETLEFLRTVPPGLFKLEIGVQSTNERALRAVSRSMDWQRLQHAVMTIQQQHNLHQHLDLIAGLPEEDYASFGRSFNMVYNLAPNYLQLGFLKMLKGSRVREEAAKHGYRFTDEPPYEVLENRYLGFDEMRRLKRIEDLLEKFYNPGDFRHSLRYLVQTVYRGEPFAFYEDLAAFWEEERLHRVQHRKEHLYSLLMRFASQQWPEFAGAVNELLKFDYLLNYKSHALPAGLRRVEIPRQRERFDKFLAREDSCQLYWADLPEKALGKLKRQLHLEVFADDVLFLSGMRPEKVTRSYYPLLFRYLPGGSKAIRWDEVEL